MKKQFRIEYSYGNHPDRLTTVITAVSPHIAERYLREHYGGLPVVIHETKEHTNDFQS